jgi:hypothetical protein
MSNDSTDDAWADAPRVGAGSQDRQAQIDSRTDDTEPSAKKEAEKSSPLLTERRDH